MDKETVNIIRVYEQSEESFYPAIAIEYTIGAGNVIYKNYVSLDDRYVLFLIKLFSEIKPFNDFEYIKVTGKRFGELITHEGFSLFDELTHHVFDTSLRVDYGYTGYYHSEV